MGFLFLVLYPRLFLLLLPVLLLHTHSLTHSLARSLTRSHSYSPTCACTYYIYIYTHTNSPAITPPSLLYFLFPSCFSIRSLSLEELVTCGVIRSYIFFATSLGWSLRWHVFSAPKKNIKLAQSSPTVGGAHRYLNWFITRLCPTWYI